MRSGFTPSHGKLMPSREKNFTGLRNKYSEVQFIIEMSIAFDKLSCKVYRSLNEYLVHNKIFHQEESQH